jgi:hypothetical protein
MQVQRRNKIGNQAFMLLFYLLMIDIGLYGFGFRWLKYPTNVFIIMLSCMTYYLVRIIWNNAYIGPKTADKPIGRKLVLIVAIAAFTSAVTVFISQKNFIKTQAIEESDNGALILFVLSIVSMIIALVVSIISKKQNNSDEKK